MPHISSAASILVQPAPSTVTRCAPARYYTNETMVPPTSESNVVGLPVFSGTGIARLAPGGLPVGGSKVLSTGWNTTLYYLKRLSVQAREEAIEEFIMAKQVDEFIKERCRLVLKSPGCQGLLLGSAGLPMIVKVLAVSLFDTAVGRLMQYKDYSESLEKEINSAMNLRVCVIGKMDSHSNVCVAYVGVGSSCLCI